MATNRPRCNSLAKFSSLAPSIHARCSDILWRIVYITLQPARRVVLCASDSVIPAKQRNTADLFENCTGTCATCSSARAHTTRTPTFTQDEIFLIRGTLRGPPPNAWRSSERVAADHGNERSHPANLHRGEQDHRTCAFVEMGLRPGHDTHNVVLSFQTMIWCQKWGYKGATLDTRSLSRYRK